MDVFVDYGVADQVAERCSEEGELIYPGLGQIGGLSQCKSGGST